MIDVVIPTRNAPEVLALCLAHYWANAHNDNLVASVTLLDNCSEAKGMDAVFAEAIRRGCRVIRHERNIGVWTSVNRGLALARSTYVLVLTSDVLLGPNVVAELHRVLTDGGPDSKLRMLGPVVADGVVSLPWLYEPTPGGYIINTSHYNGACWMAPRSLLDDVGYFDPRFYVCFGDTDFAERVRTAGYQYGVTGSAKCVHLDKQSRQADHTVDQDTEVEIRDWERFAAKWRDRPNILARHGRPDHVVYGMMKDAYWRRAVV